MPEITTLISDIYDTLKKKDWFDAELASGLSDDLARRLQGQLGQLHNRRPALRLSAMGKRCPRALWYSIHNPEVAESLPPWAEIKYAFGHVIEGLVITLAKAAGHDVQGEQDELQLDGVVGHRDCVIDGCTVDIKSASSISFSKFKSPNYELLDNFGYLDQLDGYVVAAAGDPLVTVKDKGYILAVDKQLGHMYLYEHQVRPNVIKERIALYKRIVALDGPPPCQCETEPHGASGNIKLGLRASYSAYKHQCFPHLRTFKYANGPVFLSKVVKKPDVNEIDKYGKYIYN